MRRGILGTILAAGLALPSVALAKSAVGLNAGANVGAVQNGQLVDRRSRPHWQVQNGPVPDAFGTLGAGVAGASEPGHVDSPGTTKIDPDSRGPINDVQPGRGTDDTPQSANPPPAR